MPQVFKKLYDLIETLPDRLYPFASEIEGRLVRGRQSYLQAVKSAIKTYGPYRLGPKLIIYRTIFHFVGSVIFIICTAFISQKLFGSETALYVLMVVVVTVLSFQEFYSHPKLYGQSTQKGTLDWLTWVTPMVIYVSIQIF